MPHGILLFLVGTNNYSKLGVAADVAKAGYAINPLFISLPKGAGFVPVGTKARKRIRLVMAMPVVIITVPVSA
ncbi:hypothetical protein [Acidithiobacillus sulfuriphilus]|uniref:hypothetical protein n=1 Tax=Acidithiobacillus sulfuriphilus TaxID=1867749 RepID=UPI003F6368F7